MDKVIIVGGGLGGLLLAILLERAGIDYLVLERSTEAKQPLEGGGVISLTSQIQPLLQQLGLLDQLRTLAKPMSRVTVFENHQSGASLLQLVGVIDSAFSLERYGYYSLAISRPELYNTLVDKIPSHKLLLGKEVQEIHQTFDGTTSIATCECKDGSGYEGIIIGADGAYSTVRLSLYRQLRMNGQLPARDRRPFQYENQALVGMTRPLDPERFPMVREEHSDTRVLVSQGDTPYTVWCVPMTGNRMCWLLDEPLWDGPRDCPEVEDLTYNQEAVQAMCARYRPQQSPITGVLLGELFDMTPEGTILSLPREEGAFSTWAHGKIAIMGDACHKALPYGGQPMVQAGYDAAKLANILYALAQQQKQQQQQQLKTSDNNDGTLATSETRTGTESSHNKKGALSPGTGFDSIESGLRAYERERRDAAEAVVESSRHFGWLLRSSGREPSGVSGGGSGGDGWGWWGQLRRQGWIGKWIRYVVLNYVPRFLVYRLSDGLNSDRPQATFLPKVI